MTTIPICPKCQSQNVYYRRVSRLWACAKCGPIVPEENESPGDPSPPCKVCGSHSVHPGPGGAPQCRHCGSNQAPRPKAKALGWW